MRMGYQLGRDKILVMGIMEYNGRNCICVREAVCEHGCDEN